MTLKELKALITKNMEEDKLLTYKQLQTTDIPVILQQKNGNMELKVYKNGLVSYSNLVSGKIHHTVFSVRKLELRYEFSHNQYPPIRLADYPELEEYDATELLNMCGQDRLDYNIFKRECYHASKTLSDEGTHYEKKEGSRIKLSVRSRDFVDVLLDRLEPVDKYEKLHKAMKHLTKKQKEAIYLYYNEQMSQVEIAVKLGIGRTSVENRLDGAIKKLRKYM